MSSVGREFTLGDKALFEASAKTANRRKTRRI